MSIPNSPFDLQIAGVQNDGTAEGLVRTKQTTGGYLIRMPFLDGQVSPIVAGTATCSFKSGFVFNRSGDGTGLNPAVTHGLGNSVRFYVPFSGRVFGLRWRNSATDNTRFSVLVDGLVHPAFTGMPWFKSITGDIAPSFSFDHEGPQFLVDDLPDGQHMAEIVFNPQASGDVSLIMYGYVVEARVGYKDTIRSGGIPSPVAKVPNARAAIYNMAGVQDSALSLKKVYYFNTDSNPHVVDVVDGAGGVYQEFVLAAKGSAGCSAVFDAGNIGPDGTTQHVCDAANVVNFSLSLGS